MKKKKIKKKIKIKYKRYKISSKKKHKRPYTTTHHIVPQSRKLQSSSSEIIHFTSKEKTVELPAVFHTAWHEVFDNLYTVSELTEFIIEIVKLMTMQKIITPVEIIMLREKIKSKQNHSVIIKYS